jgi:hypothetical protein
MRTTFGTRFPTPTAGLPFGLPTALADGLERFLVVAG